jgi:hypothetical protein
MRFELHKKLRYDCSSDHEELKNAQREYYNHLGKIDFAGQSTLLRYFGASFFHDATVANISIMPEIGSLAISLYNQNDREDINNFRKKHGLKTLSDKEYAQNPIKYVCTFKKVARLLINESVNFSESVYVMDSELDYDRKNRRYIVRISFWENEEIEIHFSGAATVKVEDRTLISKLLGGFRKDIPHCETCRSRMLRVEDIKSSRASLRKRSVARPIILD